jgi:superfamily I DNA and/or RNA helicase
MPSREVLDLRGRLTGRIGITVVGATPEQVHNLVTVNGGSAQEELFDYILIDEASQMDVAHAILALSALDRTGSVTLAGDPKQLAPIHTAQPPAGLEAMVGSVYEFAESVHHLPAVMLEENHRSNATLVEFSLQAGYRPQLRSVSPDLRLNLLTPLPAVQPPGWPADLVWTPEWNALLDPDRVAACFVYREGLSSQWNQFEADAVGALVWLLHGRLGSRLLNELDPYTGQRNEAGLQTPYTPLEFWERAVGVVTPHRAQQGLIIDRLQRLFAANPISKAAVRNAVDTVERFQGQQRDIIIASYALGDPDAIQQEDEFLLSLNRFNVMASRARAKLIVLVSQEVVDHLSSDLDTLRDSRLLKFYVEAFCGNPRDMTLGYDDRVTGVPRHVPGLFKSRV